MSTGAPAVLDHAVQDMNLWLNKLIEIHHFKDKPQAYSALRAGLHALRDRLTVEQAAHLGAQLPTLVRGVFYEAWRPAGKPVDIHSTREFCDHIAAELPSDFPRDALSIARAVFDLLFRELDPGESAKLVDGLPVPLRHLWPAEAGR